MIEYRAALYDPNEDFSWDATYRIVPGWVDGMIYAESVELVEWMHGDERKTKADAVAMLGADWIENQEAEVNEQWCDSEDAEDQWADQMRWAAE